MPEAPVTAPRPPEAGARTISRELATSPERPARGPVLQSFNQAMDGVPGLFTGYRQEMAPLWARVQARDETLTREQRMDGIGFGNTQAAIENVTGQTHIDGQPALPQDLRTDEWTNTYREGELVHGRQQEGIPVNHLLKWMDKKIEQLGAGGRGVAPLSIMRDTLRASSASYPELHSSPDSIDVETRKRQEAGAFIHTTPAKDSHISQHDETNRAAHERDDWQMGAAEIDNRLELVIPPIATVEGTVVRASTVSVDGTLPPRRVSLPDQDPPYRNGTARGLVPGAAIGSGLNLGVGGSDFTVSPVEVTGTRTPTASRSIPDRLRPPREPRARVSGESLSAEEPVVGIAPGTMPKEVPSVTAERDNPAKDLAEKIGKTIFGSEVSKRIKTFINTRNLTRVALLALVVATALLPGERRDTHIASQTSDVAPRNAPPPDNYPHMPGNVYDWKPDYSVAPTGPNMTTRPEVDASVNVPSSKSPEVFEGGKGKGPDTKEEIFPMDRKQSVKGVTENQLVQQMIKPEEQAEMKAAIGRGDTSQVEQRAATVLNELKNGISKEVGPDKVDAIYDSALNRLIDEQRDVIENANKGKVAIGADRDVILPEEGQSAQISLTIADLTSEADRALAIAIKGVYNSNTDTGILKRIYQQGVDDGR